MPCASEKKFTLAMQRLRKREHHWNTRERISPRGRKPSGDFAFLGVPLGFSSQGGELEKRRNQMKTFESSRLLEFYGGVSNEDR